MSSKKPIRIGLTKKPADQDEDDISALMSDSTVEALAEIVQDVHDLEESESEVDGQFVELPDLEDELDRDRDPDFVPPARPSTSKGKRLLNKPQVQPKRSLNLLTKDTPEPDDAEIGKGRSNAPIWKSVTGKWEIIWKREPSVLLMLVEWHVAKESCKMVHQQLVSISILIVNIPRSLLSTKLHSQPCRQKDCQQNGHLWTMLKFWKVPRLRGLNPILLLVHLDQLSSLCQEHRGIGCSSMMFVAECN